MAKFVVYRPYTASNREPLRGDAISSLNDETNL